MDNWNENAEAQYLLGKCYKEGLNTEVDERLAVYWYTNSALQKHGEAMCSLAEFYYLGKYVYEDEALAEALLLASTARTTATDKLIKCFDIDITKDGSYRYHASIVDAVEKVSEFLENANHDVLEMIEDEDAEEELYYPRPNKYFLPSTNAEFIIGNIKRKLGL